MGLSATFMISSKELSDPQLTIQLQPDGIRRLGSRSGWSFYRTRRAILPARLEREMSRLSNDIEGPVLAYSVHDDDWAFLIAAEGGQVSARALLNAPVAEGYLDIHHLRELIEATDRAGPDLAQWAKRAPRQAASKDIVHLLASPWDFAGTGAAEILDLLGLTFPTSEQETQRYEEATELEAPSLIDIEGDSFFTRHSVFVRGVGKDFLGIWNRERGGPPVARFPISEEGYVESSIKWRELENEVSKRPYSP